MKGRSTDGFIHIADWYTTFCNLAGVDPTDSETGMFPVDGMDVWPIITGSTSTSPHKEITRFVFQLGKMFSQGQVQELWEDVPEGSKSDFLVFHGRVDH